MEQDSRKRFSNRVADYVKYRPGYPLGVVAWLREQGALERGDHVVDLGSGTGLLSRLFLESGVRVTGVEPNGPMKAAGDRELAAFDAWRSVDGCAEDTGLEEGSVDLVVSGQAFHWFDPEAARRESLRILKPPAFAAMIWNERHLQGAFMNDYERLLLKHAPDYRKITASHVDDLALARYFGGRPFKRFETPNQQVLDLEGLRGRLMSSSYAPAPDTTACEELTGLLAKLFARHALDGKIVFQYRTVAILGTL